MVRCTESIQSHTPCKLRSRVPTIRFSRSLLQTALLQNFPTPCFSLTPKLNVQEYFFPKEESMAHERQRRWAKSVNVKSRHSRHNSATSNPLTGSDTETASTHLGSAGPAPPSSVFASAGSGGLRNSLQLDDGSPVASPDGVFAVL